MSPITKLPGFFVFGGILLALLGLVTASPAATPTTPDLATRVVDGPRRTRFPDLPSHPLVYNNIEPANAIPQYVTASDYYNGQDAIIYNREEIYNAMRQGYEVLQRTRDPEPGQLQTFGNVEYPGRVHLLDHDLEDVHLGRFGESEDIEIYMWPLLWTDGYTGHNQNPGMDRVMFTNTGVYLGVITRRPSAVVGEGYRWCPPTNVRGQWVARWIGGDRGWDFTGVPGDGSEMHYVSPRFWNVANSQRDWWWRRNPGGFPPTGSHDKLYNSSAPPPDDSNLLDFPPADNSTGVWRIYEPSNSTSNDPADKIPAPDCTLAHDHGAGSYQQSCQTHWEPGAKSMKVRITISGTGQDTNGWCRGVIQNIQYRCGRKFNLVNNQYACDTRYPGTATFSKATDAADPEFGKFYFGIDMHFWMAWPWNEADADHSCMANGIEAASCLSADVKSRNGKWCRSLDWRPVPPLFEWSNDLGPA